MQDTSRTQTYIWALLRLGLGWIFLWSFLDKLWGLGFATPSERAWLSGGSPTTGFLRSADGWFAGVFQAMSGSALADWLFMAGMLLIGIALLLGIGVRIATVSGIVMMLMMWLALLPLQNNPLIDEHIIYSLALAGIYLHVDNQKWSLAGWWQRQPFIRRYRFLK